MILTKQHKKISLNETTPKIRIVINYEISKVRNMIKSGTTLKIRTILKQTKTTNNFDSNNLATKNI